MEQWKDITGFEGFYKVSSFGRIKGVLRTCSGSNYDLRTVNERILIVRKNKSGYMRIGLQKNGLRIFLFVHRIVGKEFISNPLGKPFINHKNGIKHDNRPDNLEWVSQSENEKHAHMTGLKNHKRENNPSSKLNEIDILDIRKSIIDGFTGRFLSKKYSVSESVISNIKNEKRWKS